MTSNIGQEFLKIIDKEFPKDQALCKIFKRNSVKISYGFMTNIKQSIDGHNKTNIAIGRDKMSHRRNNVTAENNKTVRCLDAA